MNFGHVKLIACFSLPHQIVHHLFLLMVYRSTVLPLLKSHAISNNKIENRTEKSVRSLHVIRSRDSSKTLFPQRSGFY